MILSVKRSYGQNICFSSSDLLWVSEDIIIEKDFVQDFGKKDKTSESKTPIWIAHFSICIFGKEPMICENCFARGISSIEEAKKDQDYCSLKLQHDLLVKALSEK